MSESGGKNGSLSSKIEKTRTRTKSYVVDLRINTPASLGYISVDGIDPAPALVRLAETKGIDLIAITDLYSGNFIDKIVAAAKQSSVRVLPGVALRCRMGACNDVILTCLFPESFGSEEVDRFLSRLNIPSDSVKRAAHILEMPFGELIRGIEQEGGVVLPSRMDKTPQRLAVIPQLVEEYGFRAFDLAYSDSAKFFKKNWPKIKFQLFSFSNANALAQVGSRIAKLKMSTLSFEGIREVVAREPLSN